MMTKRLLLPILLAVLLSLTLSASKVYACSFGIPPVSTLFRQSDAVFSGTVIQEKGELLTYPGGATQYKHTYTVAVQTVWKGTYDQQQAIILYSDYVAPPETRSNDPCEIIIAKGQTLDVGASYLVYRGYEAGDHELLGAVTLLLANATADIEELGQGITIAAPTGMPKAGGAASYLVFLITGFAAVGVGSLLLRNRSDKG